MKRLFLSTCLVLAVGCTAKANYVPGTKVPYSTSNKSVLDACEEYRLAVERGDADALMLLAHQQ